MTYDITNFLNIVKQKNGRVVIRKSNYKALNIYQWLSDYGFRTTKFDGNRIFYFRCEDNIALSNLDDLRDTFCEFLKKGEYRLPYSEIKPYEVLNWYYSTNPIKLNSQLYYVLNETPNQDEALRIRILLKNFDDHKNEMDILLKKFDEWSFLRTSDQINSYSSNNPPLYFKPLGGNRYLLFNHWNAHDRNNDGFDCWIANYQNVNFIGKQKPLELKEVRLGFNLERDLELIAGYLKK